MNEHDAFRHKFAEQKKAARRAKIEAGRRSLREQLADAYGAHRTKAEPGSDLAQLRMRVHRAYDPLWEFEIMTRSEMYAKLAAAMGLPRQVTHIGMFDEAQCLLALRVRGQVHA